jgi:hypothetical protein
MLISYWFGGLNKYITPNLARMTRDYLSIKNLLALLEEFFGPRIQTEFNMQPCRLPSMFKNRGCLLIANIIS